MSIFRSFSYHGPYAIIYVYENVMITLCWFIFCMCFVLLELVLGLLYFKVIKEFPIIQKFRWQGYPSRRLHRQIRTCRSRHIESFDCQELHQGWFLQIHRRMQWRKEGSFPQSSFSIRQQDRWCRRLQGWYRRLRMQSQARIICFMVPKWQEDQQDWFQVFISHEITCCIFVKIKFCQKTGSWPETRSWVLSAELNQ